VTHYALFSEPQTAKGGEQTPYGNDQSADRYALLSSLELKRVLLKE
jgi:hypothetical protein